MGNSGPGVFFVAIHCCLLSLLFRQHIVHVTMRFRAGRQLRVALWMLYVPSLVSAVFLRESLAESQGTRCREPYRIWARPWVVECILNFNLLLVPHFLVLETPPIGVTVAPSQMDSLLLYRNLARHVCAYRLT